MSQAIVLHDSDNVATAIADLAEGDLLRVGGREVRVAGAVPFGHKVALVPIASGTAILKYGENIGLARGDIRAGECVHIHNVESQRGRGDRKGP